MKGILLGLLFIACGGAIIYFHRQLYKMFGDIEWTEKTFGDSRVLYPMIGVVIIVLGVLFMFGLGASDPTNIDAGFGQAVAE